jgi:enoyl-[acyl-carrier protein] reductase I
MNHCSKMLAGKVGVILGVANKRSIAWGVAEAWAQAGAQVHVVCQSERFVGAVRELVAGKPNIVGVHMCDVADDSAIENLFKTIGQQGPLHAVLHSIAHAPANAMKSSLLETTRADFAAAHDISAYSFIAVSRAALPLLVDSFKRSVDNDAAASVPTDVGSITALSFNGATRAVPGYNVMGCAKASLEATVRGLALEIGVAGVRVNALSPGPVNTVAARGIRGFVDLRAAALSRAPLRRTAGAEEVGAAATFLASAGARSISGQVIYLDGGLSSLSA